MISSEGVDMGLSSLVLY
uniref:Uncharacterized protein n=1 Tax=Arundo donax TaxID=35708 RepID=A0A0A8Y4P2_ARUDO